MNKTVIYILCVFGYFEVIYAQNQNDSILEFFHDCNCKPFFLCDSVNQAINVAQNNNLTEAINCSQENWICCPKNSENLTTTTPATKITTEKSQISTEIPELRNPTKEKSSNCGLAKTDVRVRILTPETESANAIPGEFPWLVEIFQKKSNQNKFTYKCVGSLIHEKVILTANHCVRSQKQPNGLKVVATGLDNFQELSVNPSDERTVKTIIKHPEFYSGGLHNDVALLILEEPYNFKDTYLNALCLPTANQSFAGQRCLSAGWGRNTGPVHKVDLPVVPFSECQEVLTKWRPEFELHESFLCAGGELGKDTCTGDGGAPLVCLGPDYRFVQAGVVSWGIENKCGIEGQPGMYADITKFANWIKDELKKNDIQIL